MQKNSTPIAGDNARFPSELFNHLLVGVGGSDRSLTALRYALEIARRTSAEVESLIVEDVILSCRLFLGHGDSLRRFMEEAERLAGLAGNRVEQEIQRIAREIGCPVAIQRDQGRVADCMIAASGPASLLVLGKYGHRTEHGGLLGTNTELIVRRAHKPVLLTPERFAWPSRVLIAYGGKSLDDAVLRTGITCSQALDLPMKVITIERDAGHRSFLWEKAKNEFPELAAAAAFEHDDADPPSAIARRTANDTLLVMGAHGRSKLHRMILGSVTAAVMRAAQGLVLLTAKREQDATT
ncbi:MAG: universal stress protein [Phycisphaerae bacterium]